VVSADGKTYEIRNQMTLCRCGRSDNKPFCNGSHPHEDKGFQGALVASMSIPGRDQRRQRPGGYHLVWTETWRRAPQRCSPPAKPSRRFAR